MRNVYLHNGRYRVKLSLCFLAVWLAFLLFFSACQNSKLESRALAAGEGLESEKISVPYLHQVLDTAHVNSWSDPAPFDGRWACGATAAVMIAAYYDRLGNQFEEYGRYVSQEYRNRDGHKFDLVTDLSHHYTGRTGAGAWGFIHRGDEGPAPWTRDGTARASRLLEFFEIHGLEPKLVGMYHGSDVQKIPDQTGVREEIDAGNPVLASIETPGFGHIVVIVGYEGDRYLVHDPGIEAEVPYRWHEFGGNPDVEAQSEGPKWMIYVRSSAK